MVPAIHYSAKMPGWLELRLIRYASLPASEQYFLFTKDCSEQRLFRVPTHAAEAAWNAADRFVIGLPPDDGLILDARHYTLEFPGQANTCTFEWQGRLPRQWSGLQPLVDALEDLNRRSSMLLAPMPPKAEDRVPLLDDGDDAVWNRVARTICAFHLRFGHWPAFLRIPAYDDELLVELFGQPLTERLLARVSLRADHDLDWGDFERLAAEDCADNRLDYPTEAVGVDPLTDAAFHEWLGVKPKGNPDDPRVEMLRKSELDWRRAVFNVGAGRRDGI